MYFATCKRFFCIQDCHTSIFQVEYQGQTRNTRNANLWSIHLIAFNLDWSWNIKGIQGNCKSWIYFVFCALDFLTAWRNPKQEFFNLGPSHIPTGNCKMGNAHWEDTSSPLHCALVLSLIEITDTIYICATGLSEEMICLKSSVIFHVLNLYSSYRKYAMPFQQKHSFYR